MEDAESYKQRGHLCSNINIKRAVQMFLNSKDWDRICRDSDGVTVAGGSDAQEA